MKGQNLRTIPGIGKDMEQHFFNIGIQTIDDLKGADPGELDRKDCEFKGFQDDKCLLDVYKRQALHRAVSSAPARECKAGLSAGGDRSDARAHARAGRYILRDLSPDPPCGDSAVSCGRRIASHEELDEAHGGGSDRAGGAVRGGRRGDAVRHGAADV